MTIFFLKKIQNIDKADYKIYLLSSLTWVTWVTTTTLRALNTHTHTHTEREREREIYNRILLTQIESQVASDKFLTGAPTEPLFPGIPSLPTTPFGKQRETNKHKDQCSCMRFKFRQTHSVSSVARDTLVTFHTQCTLQNKCTSSTLIYCNDLIFMI